MSELLRQNGKTRTILGLVYGVGDDVPVSIYDMPPPDLVDLRDAIRDKRAEGLNYWDALLVGAAEESYTRHVKDHYDRLHGSGGEECTCY